MVILCSFLYPGDAEEVTRPLRRINNIPELRQVCRDRLERLDGGIDPLG
jgi:hypothetical protein